MVQEWNNMQKCAGTVMLIKKLFELVVICIFWIEQQSLTDGILQNMPLVP